MSITKQARRVARPNATGKKKASDELMTVHDITGELKISRRTFYRWRHNGTAPDAFPLNGDGSELRVYRSDFEAWLIERSQAGR